MDPLLGSKGFINSAEMGLPCAQLVLNYGDTADDKTEVGLALTESTV